MPPADECPLCPTGRGTVLSEIPAGEYDVVVFENRFPSFRADPAASAQGADPSFTQPLTQAPALGRFEDVWAERTRELSALPYTEHVFPFYAYPFIPAATAYVPFAARWPVEVHLVPNRDVADPRRWARAIATSSPTCISSCCAAWTATTKDLAVRRSRCPTSPAGTRRRCVLPSGVWSAPGRVNLMGEHTEYNDGRAFR